MKGPGRDSILGAKNVRAVVSKNPQAFSSTNLDLIGFQRTGKELYPGLHA